MDAVGKSEGLAIGWVASQIRCENIWGFQSGMGIDVYSRETDRAFTMINIYNPYQDRLSFWERLFNKSWWNIPGLIVGGDLNFTIGEAEIWGENARVDELSEYFRQALARIRVLDIPSPKLLPTWRNHRTGGSYIAKRLDRFLVADPLNEYVDRIRQWIGSCGDFDHNLILLEIAHGGDKPPSPFKFNRDWLNMEELKNLMKSLWIPYNPEIHRSTVIHFVENLGRTKQATKKWAHEKKVKDEQELKDIKLALEEKMSDPVKAFSFEEEKEALIIMEKRRQTLLKEQEETWRQKSRAIWLKSGDKNTKKIQAYARGRKGTNTIWELKNEGGDRVTSFKNLAELGANHFQNLYKAPAGTSLAEIIQIVHMFPRFAKEVDNGNLMEEVSKEELKEVIHSFQHDKSPRPDRWTIEFYLDFFKLIGEDLLEVVEESRRIGVIHAPINATFIALIPKVDRAETFDDFQPISLCNCLYKIISKVISRRIKEVLSENISME